MADDTKNTPQSEIPATFSTLVLNLSTSALTAMGHEVVPGLPRQEVDLVAAKHVIDTLDMLKVRTEGNRTPEEDSLLTDMLHQLKLAYVATQGKSGSPQDKPAG